MFDELLARGLDFQWHVVGAPGWLAEHTARRIRDHPAYGERLHWWTHLRDEELAFAYRNAAALVAVSRAEGFGLPLVEARFLALPVFASDIPVFREVLGAEGRDLPLSSARLAAAVLEDFLAGALPVPDRAAASEVARPWQACAKALLDAVLAIRASP
jgi:glycosyltransferase involved in cell wall biosynthesis